jgi:hypothetical protein
VRGGSILVIMTSRERPSAFVYLDLESVHPVIEGVWHRVRLTAFPAPGEVITMLCGAVAVAQFERRDQRCVRGTPTCCWSCDAVHRRARGIAVWPAPRR